MKEEPKEEPEEEPFQNHGGTSKAMRFPLHRPERYHYSNIPHDPYE